MNVRGFQVSIHDMDNSSKRHLSELWGLKEIIWKHGFAMYGFPAISSSYSHKD